MPRPSGAAAGRSRTTRWQTTAERTWNTDGLRHRVDVYADALHERVASTASPNALGTFAYASPADLAAGRPASFERALGGRVAEASAWKAVLALSDAYQPPRLPGPLGILSTDGLTVQYGVRVDAEWFGGTRAESPLVRARFGRSTARLPAGVAAQPMAGFTWTRGVTVTQSGPARFSPVRHFAPDTRFALAEEGGRPVFAGRADVVPATGAVTAAGSRAMPELGSVLELRSDGRSTQRRGTAGLPYTPVVGGDLNGDGLANDRAFVFDPAAADSALGAGMRRLLDGGRRRVRDCLARQLGAVAAERSCRGPWYATLGVIALTPDPYRVGLRDRGSLWLYVTNALGGLDQLLHGSAGRRGWGDVALPDATLLAVRGFDPAASRFRYAVNPRFGSTAAGAPFRRPAALTIDVRVELGPNREGQALRHMFTPRPAGWGWPTEADSLRRFLLGQGGAHSDAGEIEMVLRRAGALRLTRAQVDTLRAVNRRQLAARDSIYADLARFLAARDGDYERRAVRAYWRRAMLALLTGVYESSRRFRAVLTTEQVAALEAQEWPPQFLSHTPDWFAQATRGPFTSPW